VAVDVFEGNLADPLTVAAQVDKLKHRFGIAEVVMVGCAWTDKCTPRHQLRSTTCAVSASGR